MVCGIAQLAAHPAAGVCGDDRSSRRVEPTVAESRKGIRGGTGFPLRSPKPWGDPARPERGEARVRRTQARGSWLRLIAIGDRSDRRRATGIRSSTGGGESRGIGRSGNRTDGSQGLPVCRSRKAGEGDSGCASDAQPGTDALWRFGTRGTRLGRTRSDKTRRRKRRGLIEQLAIQDCQSPKKTGNRGRGGDPILRPAGPNPAHLAQS
jgi:hypothetical protein